MELTLDDNAVSLLAQERGLKHVEILVEQVSNDVAPRAGAWIETHRLRQAVK